MRCTLLHGQLHGLIVSVAARRTDVEQRSPSCCDVWERRNALPTKASESRLGNGGPLIAGLHECSVVGEPGLIGSQVSTFKMVPAVLDHVGFEDEVRS